MVCTHAQSFSPNLALIKYRKYKLVDGFTSVTSTIVICVCVSGGLISVCDSCSLKLEEEKSKLTSLSFQEKNF